MYDPEIMNELLKQPGVKKNVKKMKPETLEWFKELLVSQGIYSKYIRERKEHK
jgi:hypothetical protein